MNQTLIREIGNLTPREFDNLFDELANELKNERSEERRSEIQSELDDLLFYRCASDIELFAVTFFPHYCIHDFNDFHVDMFQGYRFLERKVRRVRGAPRGYAKSTISAFIKPLHDLCYKLERFIVIISNTDSQAKQKLKDIRAEILTNDHLVGFYGLSFPAGKPGEKDFVANCEDHQLRFLALGSGAEIRGIRFGAFRPSKIVLDDIEHSTKVFNEAIRDEFEDWYNDVVTKIGDEQTNIEFIGTVLHPKALLIKTLKNPRYQAKLYKAIISWAKNKDLWLKWRDLFTDLDNDSRMEDARAFYEKNQETMDEGVEVLWPEKEPYYDLQIEIVETGRRSFMKEKQNSPLSDDECLFDREEFHWYQERKDGIVIERSDVFLSWEELRAYGVIDPSAGQQVASKSKKGDFSCTLSGYTDRKGRLFLHHDVTKRIPPTKQIQGIFDGHDRFSYEKFAVETNLYRNLLLPNIIDERKRRETERKKSIRIPFYEIINTENKVKRIHTLEPKVSHGWILFSRNLSEEFLGMFEEFPKADHDDGPDAAEMLWNLVNGRYDKHAVSVNPMVGR